MMLSMLSTAVALVFVPSLPTLMALRFLAGATSTGSYLCTYVIGMYVTVGVCVGVGVWVCVCVIDRSQEVGRCVGEISGSYLCTC